jgi:sugar/nucleoside kinase (ribokinase family)
MNTYLGASQHLPASQLDEEAVGGARILYLEGYLWDPEEPRAAMRRAIEAARAAGRKVAFTLSDAFVISRYGDDFRALVADGLIDILFANEVELAAMARTDDFEAGLAWLAAQVPVLVVTRSEQGAVAVASGVRAAVPAEPVAKVVDTTGAGDLFAAGFLYGHVRGEPLERCLRIGAIAAAEVISHYGARPEADLAELVRSRLG